MEKIHANRLLDRNKICKVFTSCIFQMSQTEKKIPRNHVCHIREKSERNHSKIILIEKKDRLRKKMGKKYITHFWLSFRLKQKVHSHSFPSLSCQFRRDNAIFFSTLETNMLFFFTRFIYMAKADEDDSVLRAREEGGRAKICIYDRAICSSFWRSITASKVANVARWESSSSDVLIV